MNRNNAFFKKHMLSLKHTSKTEMAHKIMEEHFGYMRIRRSLKDTVFKIIEAAVGNLKDFDFTYYINKNTPLPTNWKEKKQELMKQAEVPELRGGVYKELFENSNSSNTQVGNLLTELVAQIFPANFMGRSCKNKKVLNKKIH